VFIRMEFIDLWVRGGSFLSWNYWIVLCLLGVVFVGVFC